METAYQNDLTDDKNAVIFYDIYATRALFRMCCACLLVNIILAHRFVDHVCCNCLT